VNEETELVGIAEVMRVGGMCDYVCL